MTARLTRRLATLAGVVAVLVGTTSTPALAASGTVYSLQAEVWYTPGLAANASAMQEVSVSSPWWFDVTTGTFDCTTTTGGAAHFEVERLSHWFYGRSHAPENLVNGHGFFDYAWLGVTGALRVTYTNSTVIYHGSSFADFDSIVGATYGRSGTVMDVNVPATTVTLYAGNDTLQCAGVSANLDIVGATTSIDSTNRVTGFNGPTTVTFS